MAGIGLDRPWDDEALVEVQGLGGRQPGLIVNSRWVPRVQ
jgi:hypothetical protein